MKHTLNCLQINCRPNEFIIYLQNKQVCIFIFRNMIKYNEINRFEKDLSGGIFGNDKDCKSGTV